jgi:hypothetical protein
MKPVYAVLSLALLLCGCVASMQTDVTQFTSTATLPAGRSFAVAAEGDQGGSLEFQHYAGLVGSALQDHGFKAAAPGDKADLMVTIHYGSAGNHTEILGDPAYAGGWGWRHRGPPPFGPESKTYYAEMLEVQIFDGAAWRGNTRTMLYQGRAVGDATVNEISAAVPALVQALFTHFPGNSGNTERIIVPLPSAAGA